MARVKIFDSKTQSWVYADKSFSKIPVKGVDYFTEADKQEIAGRAAGMVEVPAANWNARPGAPGHVLNRTHWVEVTKGEEIPVDGIWYNNKGTEDTFAFYAPVDLEIGKSYVVEWDGVEYQCTAIEIEFQGDRAVGIGNTALIGGEDTGEPFGIIKAIDNESICFAVARTPGAVPFSIYHGTEVVHKLPEKYLELPTKLPNPNALTFTGAVSATYDGSEAVSIEIPGGGSGGSGESVMIADFTLEEDCASFTVNFTDTETRYKRYLFLVRAIGTSSNASAIALQIELDSVNIGYFQACSTIIDDRLSDVVGSLDLLHNYLFGHTQYCDVTTGGYHTAGAVYKGKSIYCPVDEAFIPTNIKVSTQNRKNIMCAGSIVKVWGVL